MAETPAVTHTLQLRHQLLCPGVSLRSGAYDTKRHHVLAFDARSLTLRLFSLRRELKSVPLIDASASNGDGGAPKIQQQDQDHVKRFAQKVNSKVHGGPLPADSALKAAASALQTVSLLSLTFSPSIDVFVCIYATAVAKKKGSDGSESCNVELIEPATLTRLASYPVPPSYRLSCSFFDVSSSRLVLVTELLVSKEVDTSGLPSATTYSVDLFQISRRSMKARSSIDSSELAVSNNPRPSPEPARRSTMLCIEKMKACARHHTLQTTIIGSVGLTKLYGLVGQDQTSTKPRNDESNRTVLIWQLETKDIQKYVVLRRVTLHEHVTAMALSPCDHWLFIGTNRGVLQAWNVSDSHFDATKSFPTMGITSSQAGTGASGNTGVATIQVTGGGQPHSGFLELTVMTSETGGGTVSHWRFVSFAEPAIGTAPSSCQALELLDQFCPSREVMRSSKLSCKGASDRTVTTTLICVDVNTGSSVESMVLVLRGDLIHVLKVQARLVEVCAWPNYDNVVCVRPTTLNATQGFVSLNQVLTTSVRVFTSLSDQGYQSFQQSLLGTSPADNTSRISVIETLALPKSSETFIVCGWTSGQVEIYDLARNERVALLQDQHLNASITAITVCSEEGSGVIDKCTVAAPPAGLGGNKLRSGKRRPVGFLVAVGVENGSIFAWEAKDVIASTKASILTSSRLMLAANASAVGAHTTHVIQLQQLALGASTALICSLGADASVKIWQTPTLTIVAYLIATASSHPSMVPTCMCALYRNIALETGGSDPFLAVGYDDGSLAVWAISSSKLAFSERTVPGSHGRRVTRVCSVQSTTEPLFLSASLDMTVVMWAIVGDQVEERKYFDVCAPVVDFCVLGAQVILAFAHQICALNIAGIVTQTAPSVRQPTPSSLNVATKQPVLSEAIVNAATAACPERSSTPQGPRTPHAHDFLSVSIPSAVRREPNTTTALPVIDMIDADVPMEMNPLVGWQSENEPTVQLEDEEQRTAVRAKLSEFIDRTGSNQSVAIESLADFVVDETDRALSRKQARAALLTRARHLNMRLGDIVDADTALAIVRYVLSAPSKPAYQQVSRPKKATSNIAPMTCAVTKRKSTNKSTRKAIISYNSMGEKSVRWVEVEPAVTPLFSQPTTVRSPKNVQVSLSHTRDLDMSNAATPTTPVSSSANSSSMESLGSIELDSEPVEVERPMPRSRRQRKKSVAECIGARTSAASFVSEPLVQHLKLSAGFRPLWSPDYCWCRPVVPLTVIDTSNTADGGGGRTRRCKDCGKRLHAVELTVEGYLPHFSARAILEIIGDVYAKLGTGAHTQLFKKSLSGKKSGDASSKTATVTVFGALVSVMKSRYGMQDLVELKIKQLLVSMCHFTRAVDAIAVFGEFLAMHVSADSALDEHVPHELVALCVCCYSWLYSRQMVTAGNSVVGRGLCDSRHDDSKPCDTSCGRDHWQFVPLSCALLCAQENLMYPLVNPSYLRNILMFMGEYAQESRWLPAIVTDDEDDPIQETQQRLSAVSMRWIEVHRFLRLIVGEWRQQNESFRLAERVLFVQCNGLENIDAEIVEKLRLVLSCLVFYDHDRIGVMSIADFQNILRRLRYLWPNENMTQTEAMESMEVSITFENAVRASCVRFADRERDGQLCYLDFWAMLYVVGMKTRSMIKFREIPSFCRDYKLEVAPQLSEILLCFMERSCTVLLPQGLLVGASSFDQKATQQHVRRSGGLHDGTFDLNKALTVSLSATSLIASTKEARTAAQTDMFVEPSALVLRQSASVSAVERFRPISRQDVSETPRYQENARNEMRAVSQKKGPALLRVSSLGLEGTQALLPLEFENPPSKTANEPSDPPNRRVKHVAHAATSSKQEPGMPADNRDHLYIQFHDVTPRRIRPRRASVIVQAASNISDIPSSRETVGSTTDTEFQDPLTVEGVMETLASADDEAVEEDDISNAIEEDMEEDPAIVSARRPRSHRCLDRQDAGSPHGTSPDHSPLQRRRSSTTIVRVPSVGKEMLASVLSQVLSPATTPIRELGRSRGDHHRSMSMSAIDINTAQEAIASATSSSRLTRKQSARVAVGDTNAEYSGEVQLDTRSSQTPSVAIVNGSLNDTGLEHVEGVPGERETDVFGLTVGIMSSASDTADDDNWLGEETADYSQPTLFEEVAVSEGGKTPGNPKPQSEGLSEQSVVFVAQDSGWIDSSNSQRSDVRLDGETSISGDITSTPSGTKQSSMEAPVPDLPSHGDALVAHILSARNSPSIEQLAQHEDQTAHKPVNTAVPREASGLTENKATEPTIDPGSGSYVVPDPTPEATDRPSTAQSNHAFRFSQQPNFRSGAQSFNNPFRGPQWSPRNDSDSESDEERAKTSVPALEKERPFIRAFDGEGEEEEEDNVHDMELRLSETSRRRVHPAQRIKRQLSSSRLSSPGCVDADHSDDNDMALAGSEDDMSESRRTGRVGITSRREQVRYFGKNESDDLGAEIALSVEAEAAIQQRWATLFKDAEEAMFSPLKQAMEKKRMEQRLVEELKSQLIKRRQDEARRDPLRLRNTAVGPDGEAKAALTAADLPNFRQERARRESCKQLHKELELGASARGECQDSSDVQYFHFHLADNERAGSIITLALHVTAGDADLYLSTNTLVPSATDYMWRSSRSTAASRLDFSPDASSPVGVGAARRIVLYPNDVVKARSLAVVTGVSSARREVGGKCLSFYVAVIASAPSTRFSIAVMCSGQNTEPSQAMQAVDYFIDRFNSFLQTFGSSDAIGRTSGRPSPSSARLLAPKPRPKLETRQEFVKRVNAASDQQLQEAPNEEGDGGDEGSEAANTSVVVDTESETDVESFQHLLETIGGASRRRTGSRRQLVLRQGSSFMMEGPSKEQHEILQDEQVRLQHQMSSNTDAIDTEPLFQVGASRKRQPLGGARGRPLSQRLSPLKRDLSTASLARNSHAASLRVAKFAPQPAVYSLSKLEPASALSSSSSQPALGTATGARLRIPRTNK